MKKQLMRLSDKSLIYQYKPHSSIRRFSSSEIAELSKSEPCLRLTASRVIGPFNSENFDKSNWSLRSLQTQINSNRHNHNHNDNDIHSETDSDTDKPQFDSVTLDRISRLSMLKLPLDRIELGKFHNSLKEIIQWTSVIHRVNVNMKLYSPTISVTETQMRLRNIKIETPLRNDISQKNNSNNDILKNAAFIDKQMFVVPKSKQSEENG